MEILGNEITMQQCLPAPCDGCWSLVRAAKKWDRLEVSLT